jgi:NADH-quinone oxidoreductase subunit H
LAFAVIPFGWGAALGSGDDAFFVKYQIADIGAGVLFAFAVSSVAVHGLTLAGWSSYNKYSQMGAVRASAQLISYEAAMFMAVLAMVMQAGTLKLDEIVLYQADHGWGLLKQPLAFVIFLVCAFAETNRLPFDFPEAEPELIAGYHIEYGSMKFGLFFLGEYYGMVVQSALITTLFLGGWTLPGIPARADDFWTSLCGPLIFSAKVFTVLLLYIQVRWTLPRFRFDQLMTLGWKRLIPLALVNLVATALLGVMLAPK